MTSVNGNALSVELLAEPPGERKRTADELPLLADWRCEACGRGIADGARPEANGSKKNLARERADTIGVRMCVRCRGRKRRGTATDHIPADAPSMIPRRTEDPREARRRRAYWERRLFEAAILLGDFDTAAELDAEFQRAYMSFLATAAYAGRFLKVSDYTVGETGATDVVPGHRDVPPCGCGE